MCQTSFQAEFRQQQNLKKIRLTTLGAYINFAERETRGMSPQTGLQLGPAKERLFSHFESGEEVLASCRQVIMQQTPELETKII